MQSLGESDTTSGKSYHVAILLVVGAWLTTTTHSFKFLSFAQNKRNLT
jgi:hypothetical protein